MKFNTLVILIISTLFIACTTGKSVATKELTEEEQKNADREKNLFAAGYVKGKVVDMKGEDNCNFVIQDLNSSNIWSPVNWEGEFQDIQVDGAIVYTKLTESKSGAKGCPQSKKVEIQEMKRID